MAKLVWDALSKRLYETGTSKGVLFPRTTTGASGQGVAWNGLASVKQSPEGAEESPIYANDKKYLSMTSAENFKGTIEAYTYPDEFMACDGSKEVAPGLYLGQQDRTPFDFVYSTVVGNDTEGNAHGEKMHFIYGAKAAPAEKAYETINEDPNAILFSWEFSTVAQDVAKEGFKPTAYVAVDSTKLDPAKFKAIQDLVYGTADQEPTMPSIDELIDIVDPASGG